MYYISTNYKKIIHHFAKQNEFVILLENNPLTACYTDRILFDKTGTRFAIPKHPEYMVLDDDSAEFSESLPEGWDVDPFTKTDEEKQVYAKPIVISIPAKLALTELFDLVAYLKSSPPIPPFVIKGENLIVGLGYLLPQHESLLKNYTEISITKTQ